MPPERAKKLFEELHETVEHSAEETAPHSVEATKKVSDEEKKKSMADGLPLEDEPKLDWLRNWEKEN